jgi:hypothetical protein
MPPSSALAIPTPINQVPSVVMNEGHFKPHVDDAIGEADCCAD